MSIERSDWHDLVAKNEIGRRRNDAARLALVEQAAVETDNLTGDRKWDYFCSVLQAHHDKAKLDADQLMALICNSDVSNPETLLSMKMNYLRYREREAVLEQVIALPKQITEDGESAKLELAEIGEADAAEA